MATVFLMLVSDALLQDQVFTEISLQVGDNVARLAVRACAELGLGAGASSRCHLYLAAAGGDDEPTSGTIEAALAGMRLQSGWSLERAGIVAGSWLLARVPGAAPSASRADVDEQCRGSRTALITRPTPPFLQVQRSAMLSTFRRSRRCLRRRSALS